MTGRQPAAPRHSDYAHLVSTNHLLLTSESSLTSRQFRGYAFEDCNFIQGQVGLELFVTQTGRDIGPGLDGCYVSVRPGEDGLEVGTDFAGNYKLFAYESPKFWAVSSSLMWLAREVKSRGLALSLNRAQLEVWKACRGPLFNQLTSFDTVFNEIHLIPSWLSIVASPKKLIFIPRHQPDASSTYSERLSRYLSVWLGRIATLGHCSKLQLTVDLSGGLDSRAAFSFFSYLIKKGRLRSQRILISTSDSELLQADKIAADRVLEYLGIERATGVHCPEIANVKAGDALEQWYLTSLGQYSPFRKIPSDKRNPYIIRVGGGGGEENRIFYKNPGFRRRIGHQANLLKSPLLYLRYRNSVRAALKSLRCAHGDTTDISILHYREFRSRFHSGTRAFNSNLILPLKSFYLRSCADVMAPQSLENRQVLFDILASLDPGLVDLPFDTPEKSMSDRNRADLLRVPIDLVAHGEVYSSSSNAIPTTQKAESPSTFDEIIKRIEDKRAELPLKVVSERLIEKAISDCERARKGGFARQRESDSVHFVLLCIQLLDLGLLNRNSR